MYPLVIIGIVVVVAAAAATAEFILQPKILANSYQNVFENQIILKAMLQSFQRFDSMAMMKMARG